MLLCIFTTLPFRQKFQKIHTPKILLLLILAGLFILRTLRVSTRSVFHLESAPPPILDQFSPPKFMIMRK